MYEGEPYKLSQEEIERRIAKYDGLWLQSCPKCGKQGRLVFKSVGKRRYFYCRHGDDYCYVATIENIEKAMLPKPEKPSTKTKQTTLE